MDNMNYTQNGTPFYGDANAQYGQYYATNPVYGGVQPNQFIGNFPSNNVAPASTIMTPTEISELNKLNGSAFNVTKEDFLVNMCDHKDGDKFIAVTNNVTGECYCPRCKKTFKPTNVSNDQISESLKVLDDFLNSVKLMNSGGPDNVLREMLKSYTVLEKCAIPINDKITGDWNRLVKSSNSPNGIPMQFQNNFYGYNNPSEYLNNIRFGYSNPQPVYQPNPVGYQVPPTAYPTQPAYPQPPVGYPQQMPTGPVPLNANPFNNPNQAPAQYQPPVQQPAPTQAPTGVIEYNGVQYTTTPIGEIKNGQPVAPANNGVTNITNNPVIPQGAPAAPQVDQIAPPINNK